MASTRAIVQLCHWLPEPALTARRLLERGSKRAETPVRKSHAFDPKPLLSCLAPRGGCPEDPESVDIGQFAHGQSNPTFTLREPASRR